MIGSRYVLLGERIGELEVPIRAALRKDKSVDRPNGFAKCLGWVQAFCVWYVD